MNRKYEIYCWGKNSNGQCSINSYGDILIPLKITSLSPYKVIQVTAGWEHSLVLCDNGDVYSWGGGYKDSRRGIVPPVLGLGDNNGRIIPEKIKIFDIANNNDINIDIGKANKNNVNNTVGSHSGNDNGTMKYKNSTDVFKIICIMSSWDHCLALDNKGMCTLYCRHYTVQLYGIACMYMLYV